MALADAVAGGKRPSQVITWAGSDGTALDLTGATVTARIRDDATGTIVSSDGVFTVTDAAAGQFRWDYSTTDVSAAGDYTVQFSAAFGSSPTPAKTFTASWRVREAI